MDSCFRGSDRAGTVVATRAGSVQNRGENVSYWRQPLDRDRIQVPHGIVHIIEERCKGCGFCVEFCPQRVLVMSKHTNSKGYHPPELLDDHKCVNCGLCALLCPDFAIYVENGGTYPPDRIEPVRRTRGTP
jgi:2-oxoglutarate ferredoxin oxidoreductase subunit delta